MLYVVQKHLPLLICLKVRQSNGAANGYLAELMISRGNDEPVLIQLNLKFAQHGFCETMF
jgi:hypothetical protein